MPAEQPSPIKASIVILTYNGLELTRQCLESIFRKTDAPSYELILVDNASQDGTPVYLKSLAEAHPNVRFILNDDNKGFAAGNNQGAAAAQGDYLIFLNNDTVVTHGWLTGLIRHLKDPQAGMIGPVTNSSGNETQIEVSYQALDGMEAFAREYTSQHKGEVTAVPMLAFLCVAMRRAVFEKIGPLDERFGTGMFEDDDYALRLRQKGYKILCAEDVFIHHWGSASFSKLSLNRFWELFKKNRALFEEKWGLEWLPQALRHRLIPRRLRQILDTQLWLAESLSDRENQLSELDQKAHTLWDQVQERDQAIAERDQNLQHLWEQLLERDQKITARDQAIAEKDQAIYDLWRQVADRDQYIAAIARSRAWRLVQKLWRVRLFLAPHGTLRERILLALLRSIEVLRGQGLSELLKRGFSVLTRLKAARSLLNIVPRSLTIFYREFRAETSMHNRSQVVLYAAPDVLPEFTPRQPLSIEPAQPPHTQVSLITTINREQDIRPWLEAVLQQTRLPDEVVIVDRSLKATAQAQLPGIANKPPFPIHVIAVPGVNTAKARNLGVKSATHDIIACTDTTCQPSKDWLQKLVLPFEADPAVELSLGFWQAQPGKGFARLSQLFQRSSLQSIDPKTYLPDLRSAAMQKKFWARAGGFAEWMTEGQVDFIFAQNAKMQFAQWAFVPQAVATSPPPGNLRQLWKAHFDYARDAAESGILSSLYWDKLLSMGANAFIWIGGLLLLFLAGLLIYHWLGLWGLLGLLGLAILIQGIHLIRTNNKLAHSLQTSQSLAAGYSLFTGWVNLAGVLGFSAGVRSRPQVSQRELASYQSQLRQIVEQHPDRQGIIVYPPTHDWGFMFQRPHQMARALARRGYLFFFFVYNLNTDAVLGFQQVEPNLYICHVPLQTFKILESPYVYIGSPWHWQTLEHFDRPQVIYDHYDDLEVWEARTEDHQNLLREAKVVQATAWNLFEQVQTVRPDVIYSPNAVDYPRIQQYRPAPGQEPPADLKPILEIGKPIVGYTGALAKWFDYDLLEKLAQNRPELEFVLIGVSYDGSLERGRLLEKGLANLHWLGMKKHDELFQYMWRFDVATIPFVVNEITRSTSPIKLFEYMACGLPVVTTPLPECMRYPQVLVAETVDQFSQQLDAALKLKNDPEYKRALAKVAQENTWDSRAQAIVERLSKSQGLGVKQ